MRKTLRCSIATLTVALLGLATMAQAQITPITEVNRPGNPGPSGNFDGIFVFPTVPSNSSTDLAEGLSATIVSGTRNGNGATIGILTDGLCPTGADQPGSNFFANGNCRFVYDLGTDKSIDQINSYSWHRDDVNGDRAPQVYTVYGAKDGSGANASTLSGYTSIGSVDTTSLGNGGQHGVSFQHINAKYRYILFDTLQKPGQSPTFYSEIDIVAPPAAMPPPAPTNLIAVGIDSAIGLVWTTSDGALTYNVKRSTTAGGPYTTIATGLTSANYVDSGLANGTTYYYVVSGVNAVGEGANSNQASARPSVPLVGTGDGLKGQYYAGDDANFSPLVGTPLFTEIDTTVNFNSGNGGVNFNPDLFSASAPAEDFTVRWSGQFQAPVTGPITFSTIVDDGSRLYVNGNLVVNDPFYQGPTETDSTPINMVAGQKYTIIMDYFQGGGGATAQLLYSYPGLPLSIIPQSQLYSVVAAAPAAPTGLAATAGDAIFLTWNTTFNADSYTVKRSTTAGGPYTTLASGVTAPSYIDTAVTLGTAYYYVVSATNAYGTSGNSSEASATPVKPVEVLGYNFENGPSGTDPDPVTDITGHSNDGYIFGGDAGFTSDAANGTEAFVASDTALTYLVLPSTQNPNAPASNFDFGNTFTFFVNAKIPFIGGIQTILSTNGVGGGDGGFALYVNDNGTSNQALVFETNTMTNGIQTKARTADGVFPLGDGLYHAVAVVVNRTLGYVSLYLDGVAVLTNGSVDNQWPTQTAQSVLGVFPGGFAYNTGAEFDDVRIFNKLLTPAEVAALSVPTQTVTGRIALEGVSNLATLSAGAPLGTFHVSFRTPGTTTEVFGADVTLTTSAGSALGTFSVSGVPSGTYDVAIKGHKSLRAAVASGFVVSGAATLPDATLLAGDATNDNTVNIGDFGVVVNAYETAYDPGNPNSGYDPAADFNYDGLVNIGDFGLLVNEYGIDGTP